MNKQDAIDMIRQYAHYVADSHIRGMPDRMTGDFSERKAMRWLGWVQGVLVERGVYSLDDVKEHSRTLAVTEPRRLATPTFIDLDGVVAATVEQLAIDHGRSLSNWPSGEYAVHVAWGMAHEEVWAHTDTAEWWANVPLYRHARWLVERFSAPVFLTGPMGPVSYAGKAMWCRKHFPKVPLIVANDKHLIAGTRCLLIDDSEKNVREWICAGGRALLWPRPWNSGHGDPLAESLGEVHADFDPQHIETWLRNAGVV